MALLIENVEALVKSVEEKHGIKKTPFFVSLGFDPAIFRQALAGKRPFTDRMLHALAECPYLDISYERLKAWQILDELGPSLVEAAFIETYGSVEAANEYLEKKVKESY